MQKMTDDELKIYKSLREAVSALYYDDSRDYRASLWRIIDILGGDEATLLLETDKEEAYKKYVK